MFLHKTVDGVFCIKDSKGNVVYDKVKSYWNAMPYSDLTEGKNYDKRIVPYGCTTTNLSGDTITKYGYTKNGQIIIKHKYDAVYLFKDGIAKVSIKGLDGFINSQGICLIERQKHKEREVLIFPTLDLVGSFNCYHNIAICVKDNLFGVVDKSGEIIIPCEYDEIIYPDSNYRGVYYGRDRKCYLKLIKNKEISFALLVGSEKENYLVTFITDIGMYIDIEPTQNGFYILTTANNTKTIVDCLGEQYIEENCSDIFVGDNDLVVVKRNDKYGLYRFYYEDAVYFINIVPEDYDRIYGIHKDQDVWSNDKLISSYKRETKQYIELEKEGYIGIADIDGNIVMPFVIKKSKEIRILPHTYGEGMVGFQDRRYRSFHRNPYGFINDKGAVQIKAEFRSIINGFKNGTAEVLFNSIIYEINKYGKVVEKLDSLYYYDEPCEDYTWDDMIDDAFEGDPDNYWNID